MRCTSVIPALVLQDGKQSCWKEHPTASSWECTRFSQRSRVWFPSLRLGRWQTSWTSDPKGSGLLLSGYLHSLHIPTHAWEKKKMEVRDRRIGRKFMDQLAWSKIVKHQRERRCLKNKVEKRKNPFETCCLTSTYASQHTCTYIHTYVHT